MSVLAQGRLYSCNTESSAIFYLECFFSCKKEKMCIFATIIGSDTVCLTVRISQIQTKQDRISALRANIARTAFRIFVSGMREPSLQDRIGVRAFLLPLLPNQNTQRKPKSWERVGEI